jgi:hypothetical protein
MTKLEKPIRRELIIDGKSYTLMVAPDTLKLTQKGHRNGVELRWKDIVGGDAAIATALQASMHR